MKCSGGVACEMCRRNGLQNVQGEWLIKSEGGVACEVCRVSGL